MERKIYIYIYTRGEREKERKNESACQKFIVIAGLSVIRFRCSATSRPFPFSEVYLRLYLREKKEREREIRRISNTRE